MKKIGVLFMAFLAIAACNSDDDNNTLQENVNVVFNFTQNWNGDEIKNSDYQTTAYVNANGESITLSKIN